MAGKEDVQERKRGDNREGKERQQLYALELTAFFCDKVTLSPKLKAMPCERVRIRM